LDGKLNIKVSFYKETIAIVNISGEFTVFVQEFELLYKELLAYIKIGVFRFILNLNSLSYIDSSGIGVIMRLATNASKHTSLVCVICDQPQILKILGISNVDKIVHFVGSADEGISYYRAKDNLE
jgi:anti-sigma B factor antagonist